MKQTKQQADQNEPKQERKKSPKQGRTQSHWSFRLDADLKTWLDTKPNKGRYINDLIRVDMQK